MRLCDVKDGTRVRVYRGNGSNFSLTDVGCGTIIGTIFQNGGFIAWKEDEPTTPLTCSTGIPGFKRGAYIMENAECTYEHACPQCGLTH
jgi:hypothetical protein